MSLTHILLWGLLATATRTSIEVGAQELGLSRMSIPFFLGTMFTAQRDAAMVIGFAADFVVGWVFAGLYALVFGELGRASLPLGVLLGGVHGLFLLLVGLQVLCALHPRMASERTGPGPTRILEPPGPLALNYGRFTPLTTLLAHLVYGAILGGLYRMPAS